LERLQDASATGSRLCRHVKAKPSFQTGCTSTSPKNKQTDPLSKKNFQQDLARKNPIAIIILIGKPIWMNRTLMFNFSSNLA
jgi:hypothetical protein